MAGRAACIGKTPSKARSFSIKTVNWSLRRRHTRGHCRRERTRHVPYTQSQTALVRFAIACTGSVARVVYSRLFPNTTTRNQRCTVGCPTCGALIYSNIGGKQASFVNASGFSQCSEGRGLRRLDNLRYISRCSINWTPILTKPQTGRLNKSPHTVHAIANCSKTRSDKNRVKRRLS